MKVNKGLLYTEQHEWVRVDGKGAYLGITDYAQKALGSIVYVELPEEGNEFEHGDSFGTVESVKAASDVYIPLGGRIIEVNEILSDSPELLNEDPYENWIIHFEITDNAELESLLQPEEYKEFCSKEA